MENFFYGFPVLGQAILNHLDDKNLVEFRKIGRRWKNFADQQKNISIRMIEKKTLEKATHFQMTGKMLYTKQLYKWWENSQSLSMNFTKQVKVKILPPLYCCKSRKFATYTFHDWKGRGQKLEK